MRIVSAAVMAAAAMLAMPQQGWAETVYSNTFSTDMNGFSGGSIQTAPNGEKFLGPLYNNSTTTLTLTGLDPFTSAAVSFTLDAIGSVDGDGQFGGGPDPFIITANGTTIFNFNFANFSGNSQNYPTEPSPADTGATTIGSLGYTGFPGSIQDSTYNLGPITITASGTSLSIVFIGGTNEALDNEFYGIDNVLVTTNGSPSTVTTVPEPVSFSLLGSGLAVAGLLRRRRVDRQPRS